MDLNVWGLRAIVDLPTAIQLFALRVGIKLTNSALCGIVRPQNEIETAVLVEVAVSVNRHRAQCRCQPPVVSFSRTAFVETCCVAEQCILP